MTVGEFEQRFAAELREEARLARQRARYRARREQEVAERARAAEQARAEWTGWGPLFQDARGADSVDDADGDIVDFGLDDLDADEPAGAEAGTTAFTPASSGGWDLAGC